MRHRFHSLCPYFAMFPETFANKWINALTDPGDTVLDPFAGRGTAPFEALLLGRVGVGVDVNDVAACLNRAKLAAPAKQTLLRRVGELQAEFDPTAWEAAARHTSDFFRAAYHARTLAQLLYLRETLDWRQRRSDAMISALIMGGLHGETSSSRYLSNQMPRTISTKPLYSVGYWSKRGLVAPERDAFKLLREAVNFRYASQRPSLVGRAVHGDMRTLPRAWVGEAPRLIVTSPPYRAVTSYEEDQWLRLWFLGGPETPSKAQITRDDRHVRVADYWRFIGDFWRVAAAVLAPSGHVVMRVGATDVAPDVLSRQLAASTVMASRPTRVVSIGHSEIGRRQTDAFRPGSRGCVFEVDMHVVMV